MTLPPASAFKAARQRLQQGLTAMEPGVLKIAGLSIAAAVALVPVRLEIPGKGVIEHRGLNASFLKTAHPQEPRIGQRLTHDSRTYQIDTVYGRELFMVSWTITAVEVDR